MAETQKEFKGQRFGVNGGKRCSRGQWPMAVVEKVFADKDGIARQVMIRSNGGKFKRHVRELCLVEEAKEVDE